MRALLSVYDKEGLVELAQGLSDLGGSWWPAATPSAKLSEAGIAHIEVAEVTGSPEMLGGRVKTLHPKIHGGILADRSKPEHLADLEANGIDAIDLVVSQPLPVLVGPLHRADRHRRPDHGARRRQEPRARRHRDLAGRLPGRAGRAAPSRARSRRPRAAAWPGRPSPTPRPTTPPSSPGSTPAARPGRGPRGRHRRRRRGGRAGAVLPPTLHLTLERTEVLRYGENPHQRGARYRIAGDLELVGRDGPARRQRALVPQPLRRRRGLAAGARAGGRRRRGQAAVAIIKHANPCGAAVAGDLVTAYERALECDVQSAFGGVVAIGGDVDRRRWPTPSPPGPQADVIIAASYDARGAGEADGPAQGHPAPLGPGARAGRAPAAQPRGQRAGPGRRRLRLAPLATGGP